MRPGHFAWPRQAFCSLKARLIARMILSNSPRRRAMLPIKRLLNQGLPDWFYTSFGVAMIGLWVYSCNAGVVEKQKQAEAAHQLNALRAKAANLAPYFETLSEFDDRRTNAGPDEFGLLLTRRLKAPYPTLS